MAPTSHRPMGLAHLQRPSTPVLHRHDPLHELVELGHREGSVAMVRAPVHALGDQGTSDGRQR